MSASAWVLTVVLVFADGSGTAILLDRDTGAAPEFATREECNEVLIQVAEQAGSEMLSKLDWENSRLTCDPKE